MSVVAQPNPPAPPAPPAQSVNAAAVFAPAKADEYNRIGLNYHTPIPRPKVRGRVIDFHTHLLARRHAALWFATGRHFGIDDFVSMTPLEEALGVQRDFPGQVHFIAVPQWQHKGTDWVDRWLRNIEAFYNIGSRMVKFHLAPGTMATRGWRLDSPELRRIRQEIADRKMIFMSHIGDPDTWYAKQYADTAKYGTREQHYAVWEAALGEHRDHPWLGAHLGGNPENLERLQRLLDTFPKLWLDLSATRWMVREVSLRREAMREFVIRNQDHLLWGSDQVSGDDRGYDFLASRWWCHRKLWETAYNGPSPIFDPDCPKDHQPEMHGLALPDEVIQKLYHDNAVRLMAEVGVEFH